MYNHIIDLTHPVNEHMTVYPGTFGPKIESLANVKEHGYAELKVTMVLHTGTHIDAPCHILNGTKTLSDFSIAQFCGAAVVVDCRGLEKIDVSVLEANRDLISGADFVIFRTGWQEKWNTEAYLGNCPIPTREAAHWLASMKLKAVGMDSFSVDPVIAADEVGNNLQNHEILLGAEVLLLENLTNLDKLPAGKFQLFCFPLKIDKADGSPVRAVAMF